MAVATWRKTMFGDLLKRTVLDETRRAVLRALQDHRKDDLNDPLIREQVAEDVVIELKAAFDRGLASAGAAVREAGKFKKRTR
jgi:hypothetical protein